MYQFFMPPLLCVVIIHYINAAVQMSIHPPCGSKSTVSSIPRIAIMRYCLVLGVYLRYTSAYMNCRSMLDGRYLGEMYSLKFCIAFSFKGRLRTWHTPKSTGPMFHTGAALDNTKTRLCSGKTCQMASRVS